MCLLFENVCIQQHLPYKMPPFNLSFADHPNILSLSKPSSIKTQHLSCMSNIPTLKSSNVVKENAEVKYSMLLKDFDASFTKGVMDNSFEYLCELASGPSETNLTIVILESHPQLCKYKILAKNMIWHLHCMTHTPSIMNHCNMLIMSINSLCRSI